MRALCRTKEDEKWSWLLHLIGYWLLTVRFLILFSWFLLVVICVHIVSPSSRFRFLVHLIYPLEFCLGVCSNIQLYRTLKRHPYIRKVFASQSQQRNESNEHFTLERVSNLSQKAVNKITPPLVIMERRASQPYTDISFGGDNCNYWVQ